MKNFFLAMLVIIAGCSFKKNPLSNQTKQGHYELYSEPGETKTETDENIKRIVIASTNDLEGQLSPTTNTFRDSFNDFEQSIQIGGADALSAYFEILRSKYQNVVLVDAGDIFSTKVTLSELQQFYTKNQYDAVTFGLNDFNLKLPEGINSTTQLFRDYAQNSTTPILLSNLFELKTARVVEWKGTLPYTLKEVDGMKVGIIGLIPDDIATLTPVNNRIALYVESMLQSTLRQARLLRSLGADLIVVISHQGISCGHEMAQESKLPIMKVNFEPQKSNVCDLSSPLGNYLKRLPPHLVDVVVGGRNHEKMANFVNETLVLGSFEKGRSLNYVEFFVDTKNKKLLRNKTIVHQPVFICREFFKESNDCFSEDESVDHKKRIPAKFLGTEIKLEQIKDEAPQTSLKSVDVSQAIADTQSDIAFIPSLISSSQLIVLQMTGGEVIKLLEEAYNNHTSDHWFPSPFQKNGNHLQILINGEQVQHLSHYSVLTDLESARRHRTLTKAIDLSTNRTHANLAWSSFQMKDSVKISLSAQKR
jgi:hypothetical protein